MTNQTTPSQAYVDEEGNKQQREKILQEEFPSAKIDIVYYYGSEDEVEDDQGEEEDMEKSQAPTTTNFNDNHMSKFL